jgi:ParB/RepB/Spo0J family partition protein
MTQSTPQPTDVQRIPLELLDPSPKTNVRRIFRDLDRLARSLKEHGQLNTMTVRPSPEHPGRFEVGDGERRRRAARIGDIAELLCVVRDLDDRQMVELALVQDGGRDDLHPLEEAEGFRLLVAEHGVSTKDIAAKAVRSEAYVHARLRLCRLAEPLRLGFTSERMKLRAALYFSRIESREAQEKAWEALTATLGPGEELRADVVARYVRERYLLRLGDAPFSRKDATLVPEAGACTTCPRRTGAQPQLPLGGFDDDVEAPKEDLCTDEPCFRRKREASIVRQVEEARAKGTPVLDAEASARVVFRGGNNVVAPDSAYVDSGAACPDDPKGRSYRTLAGSHAPPVTLAFDLQGKLVKLYRKDEALSALAAAGHAFAKTPARPARGEQGKPVDRAAQARKKAAEEARRAAVDRCLLQIGSGPGLRDRRALLLVATCLVRMLWHETLVEYARRHRLDSAGVAGSKREKAIRVVAAHVMKLSKDELAGAIVELVVARSAYDYDPKAHVLKRAQGSEQNSFAAALDIYGINFAAESAAAKSGAPKESIPARARGKAKAVAKRAPAARKAAKKAAAADQGGEDGPGVRGGVCRVCGSTDLDARDRGFMALVWAESDLCQECNELEDEVVAALPSGGTIVVERLAERMGKPADVVAGAVLDLSLRGALQLAY